MNNVLLAHWQNWLKLVHSFSDRIIFKLLKHFQEVETILDASDMALAQKTGLAPEQVKLRYDSKKIDQQINWLLQTRNHMLVWTDSNYPFLLKEINRPPLVLFIQGNIDNLASTQLAMVGSRKPTLHGIEVAQKLACDLGKAGLTITSGLALGIDKACHQGALMADAKTIAVLGSGIDIIYPTAHRDLVEQIVHQQGTIVSEFLPGTPPNAFHFPQRNRIISGLSQGTLVIEASKKSGSLITARYALEQNREVFAVPGSIHNFLSEGCHQLLKQGGKLVENAQDVLEELRPFNPIVQKKLKTPVHDTILAAQNLIDSTKITIDHLSSEDQLLLHCLNFEIPTPIDRMIQYTQMTAEIVSTRLLTLELQGYVTAIPGGYIKTNS